MAALILTTAIFMALAMMANGSPLNSDKNDAANSLDLGDSMCLDCSLFNRQRGSKKCAIDLGDCGVCLAGFRADKISQEREAEICSKVRTQLPPNVLGSMPSSTSKWSMANASSSTNPNFTSMTETGLTFGLVVACLAIVVCVIGAVSKFVFSAKYGPVRDARASAAPENVEHGQEAVNNNVNNDDVERNLWATGTTVLPSENSQGNGRASSVPTSSAYSSMSTLDIPMTNNNSSASMAAVAPVVPYERAPERAPLLRAAPSSPEVFARHQHQQASGLDSIFVGAEEQNTSSSNAEGSLNLFVEEGSNGAPWMLPAAHPFAGYDNHVDLYGEMLDASLLRDAPAGNNSNSSFPFMPNFSAQGPRLVPDNRSLNDSVESLFINGPIRPSGLDDSRDDASLAETDPSGWEPPRDGLRSHGISEASDFFFANEVETTTNRLASTHLDADHVDGNQQDIPMVPTPLPFRFPTPAPEPSMNTSTTTDDNNARDSNENNFDDTASIASSSMAFSEAGGSSTAMGDRHGNGRRRRCSEKEELKFSVMVSIKRSRLEEQFDEEDHL